MYTGSKFSSSSMTRHLAGVSSIFSQYCNTPSIHTSLKPCRALLHIRYTFVRYAKHPPIPSVNSAREWLQDRVW